MKTTSPELLSEVTVHKNGSFCIVRRWYRGKHPHLGTIIWGLTGWETYQEAYVIRPMITIQVVDTPNLDIT